MTTTTSSQLEIRDLALPQYEKVVEAIDPVSGLHAIIALHNTTLGPALGGTRMYPYASREEALVDVLRLAEGMTYKSSVAGIGFGGGKSVVIGDPKTQKSEALLCRFAEVVNSLEGKYICAEDMGTSSSDMAIIRQLTRYVSGLSVAKSSGDPSRFTAYGVFVGMQAVAKMLWGSTSLENCVVAIQGTGSVGALLMDHLFWAGAKLIITDTDTHRALHLAQLYHATFVPLEEIYSVPCDIFSPCAIGGTINQETIARLQCRAVAGAANNQLLTQEDCDRLRAKGILYAPDFVINAGGVINVAHELEEGGYCNRQSRQKTGNIFHSLMHIFENAQQKNLSTHEVALQLAKHNLAHLIGKRTSVHFHH